MRCKSARLLLIQPAAIRPARCDAASSVPPSSLWWFSVVDVAALPRVLFEDREFPSTSTEPEMFLLSSWVDAPTGPVVVRTSVDGLDEEQLLAVARLLRR